MARPKGSRDKNPRCGTSYTGKAGRKRLGIKKLIKINSSISHETFGEILEIAIRTKRTKSFVANKLIEIGIASFSNTDEIIEHIKT